MTPDDLISIGGKRWQKSGKDRIYFNNLCDWYGLELDLYRSGSVSGAWVDGEHISNSQGSNLRVTLSAGKLYFENGRFYGQNLPQTVFDRLVARIKAKLVERDVAPPAPEPVIPVVSPKTASVLPEGYVRADCGHIIPRSQLMSASLGHVCFECYDRWS